MSRLAGVSLSSLLIYFAYHAFAGEQGLSNWRNMQVEAASLKTELDAVKLEIARLEEMVGRLQEQEMDVDFVEELIHDRLIYASQGEFMLAR